LGLALEKRRLTAGTIAFAAAAALAAASVGCRGGGFGGGAGHPTADLTVSSQQGWTVTVFSLDASGSTDDDTPAAALEVRWDFDGDGHYDTDWSATKTAAHTYGAPGTYYPRVIVRDEIGRTDVASATIEVLDSDGLILTAPVGGETWEVGDDEDITWLSPGSLGNIVIEISRNGGSDWTEIATVADTGSYTWTVTGPFSDECLVQIYPESEPAMTRQSEEEFMVYETDRSVVLTDISPVTTERWLDIAGNEYADAFKASYDYDDANVTVYWASTAPSFVGRIEATGLKPNFAYQIKLCGVRSFLTSFENIGYLGRWWIDLGGTNYTDADYVANKDDPTRIIESYILFEHLVTDNDGAVTKVFNLKSTLHVIWSQELNSRDPGPLDSEIYTYSFTPSGPAYETALGATTQHLWLEHEWVNPRPAIGEAVMTAGAYVARVVLTEESFHQSGLGGTWATVLTGDVDFTVP